MSRNMIYRILVALLVVFALSLTACGGGAEPAAEEAAPTAEQEEATPAEEETAAEETVEEEAADAEATEPAEEEAVEEEAAADEAADAGGADLAPEVFAAVEEYLTTVPEGFMSVGQVDAFKEMMEATDVYLIDVREPGEYAEGYIGNAVNIPMRTLAQNLDQIPTDQPVVVYCASGHRAGMSTTALRVLGYDNVRAFPSGFRGWTAGEEEVSTEPMEAGTFETPDIDPAVLEAVDAFLANIPEGYYAIGAVDALKEMMDMGAMTLIDVREEGELEEGIIPSAITIPMRTLTENLERIPMDQPAVTYCASGYRAALSAAALHILGYDNTRAFPPSFNGWTDAGEEVAAVE